jgi:hypothetical protein
MSQLETAIPSTLRQRVIARFYDRYAALAEGVRDDAFPTPWYSINAGSAGLAYAFYRLHDVTGEEQHLCIAERIIDHTVENLDRFSLPAECAQLRNTGSLYHSTAVPWFVRSLVKSARRADAAAAASVEAFVACSSRETPQIDVTVGRSSILLAVALLLERCAESEPTLGAVRKLGVDVIGGLEHDLSSTTGVSRALLADANFAHGAGGVLYALLRGARALNRPVAPWVINALDTLAATAERDDRGGARWPVRETARGWGPPSWCNGASGHVELWLEAARFYGRADFADLAEDVAYFVGQQTRTISPILCCGLVGQAFSLLAVSTSPDDEWSRRASELAELSAQRLLNDGVQEPQLHGLYSGEAGAVLLYEMIARDRTDGMPIVRS